MNKVILVGRTTRAFELKHLPSGSAVGKTGFATSEKFRDKTKGETKEKTMFIDIVFYGKSAEIANTYVEKGKKLLIEGKLVLDQWEDSNNQKRSKHSLAVESFEFLDSKSQSDSGGTVEYNVDTGIVTSSDDIDLDSEIPF